MKDLTAQLKKAEGSFDNARIPTLKISGIPNDVRPLVQEIKRQAHLELSVEFGKVFERTVRHDGVGDKRDKRTGRPDPVHHVAAAALAHHQHGSRLAPA